jgi:hypothetical protein
MTWRVRQLKFDGNNKGMHRACTQETFHQALDPTVQSTQNRLAVHRHPQRMQAPWPRPRQAAAQIGAKIPHKWRPRKSGQRAVHGAAVPRTRGACDTPPG